MSSSQKLTKKQKKGLAFRERKTGKGKTDEQPHDEDNAIPVMEDQDLASSHGDTPQAPGDERTKKGKTRGDKAGSEGQSQEAQVGGKGKGKGKEEEISDAVEVVKKGATKKRKREGDDVAEDESADATQKTPSGKQPKKKRTKIDTETKAGEKEKPSKQRFILFLGNLKYTTPLELIQKHFAACDPPPTIRLLTPKKVPGAPAQKLKSKGCAFLEFTHRNALQQGLKLHQTTLDGRQINVELTAGGGGKSDTRLTKVKERNKALFEEREERVEKEAKEDNSFPNLPSKPQRFSATSGLDHNPVQKRTWTVGDTLEEETHRGGQRHKKKSKLPSKTWGTGVNAIPVG